MTLQSSDPMHHVTTSRLVSRWSCRGLMPVGLMRQWLLCSQAACLLGILLLATMGWTLLRQPVPDTAITAQRINHRIAINQADERMLSLLPGIGPGLARNIVVHRETHGPFLQLEDLTSVPRIGLLTLERIRPYLRLDLVADPD